MYLLVDLNYTENHDFLRSMQMKCEAQTAGLQSPEHPYALPCNDSPLEAFLELKDDVYTHSTGNNLEPKHSLNNKLLDSSIEFNKKTTHFGSWSPVHPAFHKGQLCQWNGFQSHHPYSLNNRVQYAPVNMCPQNHPSEYQYQELHYFVVIDFEATCDKEKNPHPQEIIEFPSVIVSTVTGQLEACFQTYVRPTCNQLLSDFCKDLTGIQQIQVDRGITLSEALLRHDKWLEKKGIKNTNFAVVTWSNWDCRVMLESECRYKKIRKPPYFNRWINLKVPFREVFGGMRCNLKEAVQMAGLTWQGRPHCGLDDAKNTARLLALLMQRGFKFSITNSMMCQATTDQSLTRKHHHQPILEHHHLPSPPHHHHPQRRAPHFPPIFHPYCHCGVRSSKGMVRKPGPKQGSCFFGCGNWTSTRGARYQYFEWASRQ